MINTNKQHGLRHCAGGRTDRRGSAILLVLVSMVLMAMLAGSLLQLTRFERIPRSESNIEVVIASVIDEILNQATDDLLDDTGKYLNTAAIAGGYDEPFDFPWTNSTVTGERTADYKDGTPVSGILGGRFDDTWLAAHMPDFGTVAASGNVYSGGTADGTNGVWRKITSLTGLYLGGTSGSADLSTVASPNEYPLNNLAATLNSDTNINTASALLVDADGDGIGDSRWEWAPLRQVGATQYIMAVRIVDLSARMDLNVAMGRFLASDAASASRGDSPIELNGNEFVADITPAASAGTTQNEWREVLNYRLTGVLPDPTDVIGATAGTEYGDHASTTSGPASRRTLWTDGASRVSNTFERHGEDPASGTYNYDSGSTFALVDAFELLQGNGLNSPNTTTVEELMPTFLRGTTTQEYGYAVGSGTPPWPTRRNFWELDPRKHVSTVSGSAISAKPGATGQDRELKIDINEAVKTPTGRTALRNKIDAYFSATGNRWPLLTLYPHINNMDKLSDQLTANIADYIDDDNTITLSGNNTGFEALPYITEVYIQRPYAATTVTPGSDTTGSFIDVVWDPATASTTGYAIEIGNPFGRYDGSDWVGRPISLDNVWLRVGTSELELSAITGAPSELAPGEVLIVSADSTGGIAALDDVSNLWATATPSGNASIAAEVTGPTMPDGTVTISLHAEDQDAAGSALGWYYSACEVQTAGGSITEQIRDGAGDYATVIGNTTYIQTNYLGIAEGLRMMTTHPKPKSSNPHGFNDLIATLTEPSLNRDDTAGTAVLDNITPEFSSESKTGEASGFTNLADQQIVWPDSERQRMHWVGDILQIPLIGPNRTATGDATTTTMAQALYVAAASSTTLSNPTTGDGIDALMLPYKAGAPVVGAGTLNYPHAILLLEQLTTFSPASDGENGDGSTPAVAESVTSPNDDEVLVPGKLNLNTASRETLVRLLPFPDLTTRQAIADAIIERRESMIQASAIASGGYATGVNGLPGVAYPSALYEQIENLGAVAADPDINPSRIAGDTSTIGTPAVRVDLNDHETTLGTYVSADGVIDDREEEIMLAKWLAEVADTRSDVFAAYIVVQGYTVDNFSAGATESARLIVIFSRAGVKGSGDKAVEIGRFRID